jgi:carboxymethylenebutenolidase
MKTSFALFVLSAAVAFGQSAAVTSRLSHSPRHREWVTVKSGDRQVNCFVTYPEVPGRAPAVLIIHEIFGLSDWARSVTDQLAEHGYIAIAPDLLSGAGPNGGGTSEFSSVDAVVKAIGKLPPDQITADLNAVADYVAALPSCNGELAVAGFCWGGGQTFRYATNNPKLKAAFVFYGPGPTKPEDLACIQCPVYGFYAGNDARVSATVPKTTELMNAAGKIYEPVTYDGAGHGFMRAGEDDQPTPDNQRAMTAAWQRWLELLAKTTGA